MTGHPALARNQLSTSTLVLIIIAASAPLTVLAGGAPTSFAVSGLLGLPLSYLIIGVILVCFTVGYAAMSARVQNAGAFYAYISRGLGPRAGTAAAMIAMVSYNMLQIGLYGLFGFTAATAASTLTGLAVPWWCCALVAWALVAVLGRRGVQFTSRIIAVLVALEFLIVVVIAGLGLATAQEGVSTASLRLSDVLTPGIGVLLAFTVAAFLGFESGAIYSEETKNPRKTVARATYIAVSIIAVFYAFSTWSLAMGVGPNSIISEARELGPDLVFIYLAEASPLLAGLAQLIFLTSVFAALMAFHNVAARYFFAMGRARVLPAFFSAVSGNGAPVGGSLAQSGVALAALAVFAVGGINSPTGELYPVLTLFTWFSTTPAFGLVMLMSATSFAVLAWFRRHPGTHGVFTRVIAPAVAGVALSVIAALILTNFGLMIGDDAPQALMIILPGAVFGAAVVGLLWPPKRDGHMNFSEPEILAQDHREETKPQPAQSR